MACSLPPQIFLYFLRPGALAVDCQQFLSDRTLTGVFGVWPRHYFAVFAATCFLEAPFYFWGLSGRTWKTKIAALVFLNLSTHPLVGLGFPQFFALNGFPKADAILFSELFAPTAEALGLMFLTDVPARKAIAVALSANLFSWWIGGWFL